MNALNQDLKEWEERAESERDIAARHDRLDRLKALRKQEIELRRILDSGRCTATEHESYERDLQECLDKQDDIAMNIHQGD